MSTTAHNEERLVQLRAEVVAIEGAMREAAHDVVMLHKRADQPVVTWQDGKVVLVPADQIPMDDRTRQP